LVNVLAAHIVIVRKNGNPPAAKVFGIVGPPLAGPLRVRGRNETEGAEALNVFFSLNNNDPFLRICLEKFREAIQHTTNLHLAMMGAVARLACRVVSGLEVSQAPDPLIFQFDSVPAQRSRIFV
jgi:hypothetical protein